MLKDFKAFILRETTTRECAECLSSIPIGARRWMFCTSQVAA